MITIAIANQKGGVGKTTTAVVLGQGLAILGHKVLIVDTDAQGHVAEYIGIDPADDLFNLIIIKQPIADCITYANAGHNLALIRSSQQTAVAKVVLGASNAPIDTLANALLPLHKYISYCLIDTAPSLDALGLGTLYAADYVLIPTLCEHLGLDGVNKVIQTIYQVNNTHDGTTKLLGIIPTKYREGTRQHYAHLDDLAQAYSSLIYPRVPQATAVGESVSHGEPLWTYDPRGLATQAYRAILERLLRDIHHGPKED